MKQVFSNIAQSTIEFTFGLVVVMLLIYGMVQIFRWAGMDLASRRVFEDTSLTASPVCTCYQVVTPMFGPITNCTLTMTNLAGDACTNYDPSSQLNSDLDSAVLPLGAVYHGTLSNGNASQ